MNARRRFSSNRGRIVRIVGWRQSRSARGPTGPQVAAGSERVAGGAVASVRSCSKGTQGLWRCARRVPCPVVSDAATLRLHSTPQSLACNAGAQATALAARSLTHTRLPVASATGWQEATMIRDPGRSGGEYATHTACPVAAWASTACEPAMMRPSMGIVPWCMDRRLP
jgi:hypothetical protein